ncbi:Vegetative protein 19 [uncultured Flavonifractor sp.]|jgi:elongation factor G|uniref:Elongation factor G n=1 Tax=Flintibacter hominis TaxID=2763048 RepID=A0A8J6M2L2_9FIRM|nr:MULTISPECIES: elongation factor G [Eubacteriales]MBS5589476.1 elongation factor G [Clostridiales bacterium]SCH64702.1 Vegetative protein 19 [uncultured Clostridium sp.]SCI71581.1 Vegetative protein 19 [uncultured Flavonifractor sp.]MBC5722015.1 elongation factor G [Flintibacter hominis]MCH1980642.1 elongation factor G [Lawsonibacter sp. OA9]
MSYSVQNIRNVCLLGHGGSGKTALAESLLYMTGALDRMGKSVDGNTVCDYDPEEVKRQISISLAVAPLEYKGCKINVLDAPGGFDFAGEVMEALRAADAAIIVCSAKDGISVGLEKAWKYCEERNMPRFIYISKTDEENSDYNATFEALREKYGNKIAPVVVPIWNEGKKVTGIIDVLNKRAYEMQNGKRVEIDIPEGKEAVITEFNDALKESVAETSEEFMDKFFGGEDFTYAEMIQGLRQGVRELSLFPVLCGSAVNTMGSLMLMDYIVDLLPNPMEGNYHKATRQDGETEPFVVSPGGVPTAFVFKTVSDQYGKYSYIKVLSGVITSDLTLVNARTGASEKLGRLYVMRGKKAEEVKELGCGDIGAIGKMEKVKTGDTLCDPRKVVALKQIPFAEACYSVAIAPKTRGQEDKVAQGLNRLNEEDPSFYVVNNAETHQMVIYAAGDIQVDVLVSKLKSRFNVDAELKAPRVPYREKIRKTVQKQGRHKKQTGGSGQFGDVWIRFEPNLEEEEMVFAEEVFGGSVPKNFFPAVEKGLREACVHGPLAGYPVVNLKAVLYDGSYHPVDSSEIAFKTAAQLAYKAAMPEANPVLLEPVGELKVTVPDSYMGDVIGDLNKRRGRVMGMTPTEGGEQVIEAEVPMAEMTSYAIDLRAMTQSRGSYVFHFVRYEDCPPAAQEKAIAAAKAMAEE